VVSRLRITTESGSVYLLDGAVIERSPGEYSARLHGDGRGLVARCRSVPTPGLPLVYQYWASGGLKQRTTKPVTDIEELG